MEWPQTTCAVVRVFPEVAYVGGWWVVLGPWVEQQWRRCSLRLQGLSLVCVSHCGVSSAWLEPSETWDVELVEIQHHIQDPEGFSHFVYTSLLKMGLCLCCCLFFLIESEAHSVYFVSRRKITSWPNEMRSLHVKNKWPLCHAWHYVDMNC